MRALHLSRLALAALPLPPRALPRAAATLLLAFKASFSNGNTLLASWTGADPCAGWRGVVCKSGSIVRINLSGVGLSGAMQAWELPDTLRILL